MRKIILHLHIFKNSGSSIDRILKNSFGKRWSKFEGPEPWSIVQGEEMRDFLAAREPLAAVSSHQLRPPLPAERGWEIFPIVFMRHPIDRVASVFHYEQRVGVIRKEWSMADFLRAKLGRKPIVHFQNYQVLCLSRASGTDQRALRAEPHHLEEAKTFLQGLACFGIVDEFDVSMRKFEWLLTPHFPELTFEPVHENRSETRAATLPDRIAEMETELGEEVFHDLMRANELDLQLYEFATQRFAAGATP